MTPSPVRVWSAVAGLLLAMWCSAFVGLLSHVTALAFVTLGVWLASRRRWRPFAVLIVASPFAVASLSATVRYARGTATLQTVGLRLLLSANVDPDTRYQYRSSGCIVSGSEWVLQAPNNATLRMLNALFGPMPGAYDGPYPTEAEARAALGSAVAVPWDDVRRETLMVNGRSVRLRAGTGAAFAAEIPLRTEPDPPLPRVALFRDRVLIIEFPRAPRVVEAGEPLLCLVDVESGRVFAYLGAPFVAAWKLPHQWT